MANGNNITDYLARTSGAPSTPSLADNATETGLNWRTDTSQLGVWDGSTWHTIQSGFAIRLVTGNTTMADSDDLVIVDASGASADITITLPDAAGTLKPRAILVGQNSASHNVIVAAHASQKISDPASLGNWAASVVIDGGNQPWQQGNTWSFINDGPTEDGAPGWQWHTPFSLQILPTGNFLTASWEAQPNNLYEEISTLSRRDTLYTVNRHPWSPDDAHALYAEQGAFPSGWTFDSGLSATFFSGNGRCRLHQPDDTTLRYAKTAITSGSEYDVIARFKLQGTGANHLYFGLTAAGTIADLDGFLLKTDGTLTPYLGGTAETAANVSVPAGAGAPYLFAWLRLASGTLDVYIGADPQTLDHVYSGSSGLTPTNFILGMQEDSSPQLLPSYGLWLDYLAFGNTYPGTFDNV